MIRPGFFCAVNVRVTHTSCNCLLHMTQGYTETSWKKTLEQFLNNLHANIIASKMSFMVKYAFFAAPQKMGPLAISRLSPPMPNGYWIASLNIGSEKKSYPRRLPLSVRQAGSSHWKTSVFPWVFPYPLPRMRDSPWPNQDDEWHVKVLGIQNHHTTPR